MLGKNRATVVPEAEQGHFGDGAQASRHSDTEGRRGVRGPLTPMLPEPMGRALGTVSPVAYVRGRKMNIPEECWHG